MHIKLRFSLSRYVRDRLAPTSGKEPFLWGAVTGVLYSTSYPPFPAWALFFAYAPLWIYWSRAKRLQDIFWSGFTAQFVMTLIGFNWIAHTATEYGHIPRVLSILILIGFCCFASLNVVCAGLIAGFLQKKWPMNRTWFFIFVAVVSGACDWLYPTIFPWNTGYPLLYSHFHAAQLAEFMGFNLLGTLVYLANAAFAISYVNYPKKNWGIPLVVFVAGLVAAEWGGRAAERAVPRPDKSIKALLVQPDIGNYDKYVAERGMGYQEPIVKKDFEYTVQGLASAPAKPDVIIWPETAYPASLDPWYRNTLYAKEIRDFVDKNGVPIITGSYSDDPPWKVDRREYNAVFSIIPHGEPEPGYRKQLLLAFGEYFPGAEYFPFLKSIVPEISDFGRGKGPAVFDIGGATITPLICYEGLDTTFVSHAVKLGGQIIVNVTNDSWFGKYFEPRQHMIMTVARTIEFRRPLIRVTNTGLTVVADQWGHILVQGPQDVVWTKLAEVPYVSAPKNTLYFHLVPWISLIFALLAIGVFVIGRMIGREKHRT